MSDFDVDKMIEKQRGAVQFNSSEEWVRWTSVGGRGGESGARVWGEGILFHRVKTTRKSHFSQCINLPRTDRSGGEGRNGGRGRGGDTEEDKVSGV